VPGHSSHDLRVAAPSVQSRSREHRGRRGAVAERPAPRHGGPEHKSSRIHARQQPSSPRIGAARGRTPRRPQPRRAGLAACAPPAAGSLHHQREPIIRACGDGVPRRCGAGQCLPSSAPRRRGEIPEFARVIAAERLPSVPGSGRRKARGARPSTARAKPAPVFSDRRRP